MAFEILTYTKNTAEILIMWFIFYRILVFFQGTRSFQVLKGIIIIIIAFLVAQIFGLDTLKWILTKIFAISVIAILIIFQQELRLGLARLGQQHLFNLSLEESEVIAIVEEITSAAYKLAQKKVGCIIAIEKEDKLKTYIESGIFIDGKISSELLQSIFKPQSPLHDGGVITRGENIIAASCLFPLSDNPNFSKIIGTRHRAALGLTEQTDAIVVMVSEESGEISVASDGRFIPVVSRERLVNVLKNLLLGETHKGK
ncbi:MAG: diadenylate cyclase CdaA [Candidatus Omnitrophica bacterium]|nr:diadenylate cyclase CdaA [Candidatus Omnitrophota bacterium]